MADPWHVLESVIDDDLASIKRNLMDQARQRRVMGGANAGDEGTTIRVELEVDLDAVLRTATSSRVVQQVLRTEGEEDHSAAQVTRKRKVKDSPQA